MSLRFQFIKKLINGALAPSGYVILNRQNSSEVAIRLATKNAALAKLQKEMSDRDRKLGSLTKRLERSEKEREAMRLKLQRAVRADLERQFRELNKR